MRIPQSYFERKSQPLIFILAVVGVLLLGVLDYITGYEMSFAIFYLIPVALVAWSNNRLAGIAISILSAAVWLLSNQMAGETFSNNLIPIWNTTTRLGFFLVVSVLLLRMRQALEKEKLLSRTDSLTGAMNGRAFRELLDYELDRARRYNLVQTLAYIDLDNFKTVNDTSGHAVGDDLLQVVVRTLNENLRATDSVARLGGDEFILMLPQTNYEAAEIVVQKVRGKLLDTMQKSGWPVTFSIGVTTCGPVSNPSETLLKMTDGLMYTAKNKGKNNIYHEELVANSVLETPASASRE